LLDDLIAGVEMAHANWLALKPSADDLEIVHDAIDDAAAKLARLNSVAGADFGQVTNWHESQHVNGREAASDLPPPRAPLASDASHAIKTSAPEQTSPDMTPESGVADDRAWEQLRAELAARVGHTQLTDVDELELRVFRIRGFDPVLCAAAIRKHFDEQGTPIALIEFSTPLAHLHLDAGKTFMPRHEALALATGRRTAPRHQAHGHNAALSRLARAEGQMTELTRATMQGAIQSESAADASARCKVEPVK
jgi:hypothetical protein